MKRRITTLVLGLACMAALVAVPSAFAAYASPKLQVTQAGNTTVIKSSVSPDDDATASVRIYAPTGTQLATNQAPGTAIGTVDALVRALDLAGADLPFKGQLLVAPPGAVDPAVQAACTGGVAPLATWILALTAAGQAVNVPAFVVPTSGAQTALGPAYIQVCLAPPDVPAGTPGRAIFGAKLYSATLTVNGVFSAVPLGAWISFWTPYNPGVGTVNAAGTVAAPAAVAPGAVTIAAKRLGLGALVAGRVTQAGQGRGGATVTVFGGTRAGKVKRLGSVKAKANGAFTFRARRGTFFKATVVAAPADAPPLCTQIGALLSPIPCVNPTVNGFTASSKVVKKKK
jgi:hypothetical protein